MSVCVANTDAYSYKIVSSHPVQLSIIFSESLAPGLHPVILLTHGGYLISGRRDLATGVSPWLLQHALSHNAIIVSADYRLLPTPNGASDINDDLEDLWTWFRTKLSGVLAAQRPEIKADLDRVLLWGGSAGGYFATQLALSHADQVRALAVIFPMLDPISEFSMHGYMGSDKTLEDKPKDSFLTPDETRRELDRLRGEGVVSSAGPERDRVMFASIQWGIFGELFDPQGEAKTAWLPIERIKSGSQLPGRTLV